MVHSTRREGRWNLHVSRSFDGVTWGRPVPVFEDWSLTEALYVTICGNDASRQRVLVDDEMHVFVVRSGTGGFNRWNDASIELISLHVS
jgi:hypothetical protein